MKKIYTSTFKAQVVLELLKEEKSLAQLSSEHGVHSNVLRDWKAVALKNRDELGANRQAYPTNAQGAGQLVDVVLSLRG